LAHYFTVTLPQERCRLVWPGPGERLRVRTFSWARLLVSLAHACDHERCLGANHRLARFVRQSGPGQRAWCFLAGIWVTAWCSPWVQRRGRHGAAPIVGAWCPSLPIL